MQQQQQQQQQQRVLYVLHPPASFTMGSLDTNVKQLSVHPPSQTPDSSNHRGAQKPFRSTIQGKGGAAHVHIAWGIYFHKQLKKMQEENKSICIQPSLKSPRRDLPDSAPYKESQHLCRGHPSAGCYRSRGTPSEEVEDSAKEKLPEKIFTELTVRRSLYSKRQLQWDSSVQERRVRPKTKDYHSHPSSTLYPNSFLVPTTTSHNRLQTQAFYVLHPKGAESIISYPETIFDPYQAALRCSYFPFDQRFEKRKVFQDFFLFSS
ncbi:hypothetical protein OJAV_G00131030 [Oryzias javanicus]|uniref:Uncharacterized protein n=1 Tax=Oryzias javanicus TaxID=123683 RepID=A0A3S2PYW3_ORYJA|nr:hypothetical protein OJAV_G00131030 [Oryzias javanicus]